tara:strand:+ start:373 stop:504 length:132 start_codon:yes stop_codon:yes gene_type:complete
MGPMENPIALIKAVIIVALVLGRIVVDVNVTKGVLKGPSLVWN